MKLKFGWGWKVALLYSLFVTLMLTLVVASSRQKFDLVSKEYYKDEIGFQKVIDADLNQTHLAGTITVKADSEIVQISFPEEFSGKSIQGDVYFYSAVNEQWDRSFPIIIHANCSRIDRNALQRTKYRLKISYTVEGKSYYKENDINLAI